MFKERPIISCKKEKHPRERQNIQGQHTVSRRYRRTACYPLQFFTKNNLRIQKARVGVSLYVQL